MKRREVIAAIFGTTFICPRWLEKLLLDKHSTQIIETPNYDGSARQIVERVLAGSDRIDAMVLENNQSRGCLSDDDYSRGFRNALLVAQVALHDGSSRLIDALAPISCDKTTV